MKANEKRSDVRISLPYSGGERPCLGLLLARTAAQLAIGRRWTECCPLWAITHPRPGRLAEQAGPRAQCLTGAACKEAGETAGNLLRTTLAVLSRAGQ